MNVVLAREEALAKQPARRSRERPALRKVLGVVSEDLTGYGRVSNDEDPEWSDLEPREWTETTSLGEEFEASESKVDGPPDERQPGYDRETRQAESHLRRG